MTQVTLPTAAAMRFVSYADRKAKPLRTTPRQNPSPGVTNDHQLHTAVVGRTGRCANHDVLVDAEPLSLA